MTPAALGVQLLIMTATVAAHLTTTLMYPYDVPGTLWTNTNWPTGQSYVASVVDVNDATTTLQIGWDDSFKSILYSTFHHGETTFAYPPWTWIVGPTTLAEIFPDTITSTRPCSIESSTAWCIDPTEGVDYFQYWCSEDGKVTVRPPATATYEAAPYSITEYGDPESLTWDPIPHTVTIDFGFCTTESTIPEKYLPRTPSPMGPVQVVITAGEEKLPKATAASTVTTASGAGSAGAAAAGITMAPLLAGMGAAAAAMVF